MSMIREKNLCLRLKKIGPITVYTDLWPQGIFEWAGIQAAKGILHACVRIELSSYELSVLAPIATTTFTSALRTWIHMTSKYIYILYGFIWEIRSGGASRANLLLSVSNTKVKS